MINLSRLWSLASTVLALSSTVTQFATAADSPLPLPPRPRILGLSHVAVKATDCEKSVAFYRDFLGFAEQGRLFYPTNGRRELVFLKISDSQTIEVFDAANVAQVASQLYQVALQVEDADSVRVHLARHGFRMPPVVARGQMKNANFTTRDPNGYIIEVVQYLPEGRMVQDRGKFISPTRISDHLIAALVLTSKLDETLRCYCDVLGFAEGWRAPATNAEPACIALNIPGCLDYVEVVSGGRDAAQAFRLEVPNVDDATAELKRRAPLTGYEKPIVPFLGRNGHRLVHVFDPDGVRVELMEAKVTTVAPSASTKLGFPARP